MHCFQQFRTSCVTFQAKTASNTLTKPHTKAMMCTCTQIITYMVQRVRRKKVNLSTVAAALATDGKKAHLNIE